MRVAIGYNPGSPATSFYDPNAMSYENTNPKGAQRLLDEEDYTFVDVRTPEEFEAGHVPGAYNIPFGFRTAAGMEPNPLFVDVMERLFAKDAKIVFG